MSLTKLIKISAYYLLTRFRLIVYICVSLKIILYYSIIQAIDVNDCRLLSFVAGLVEKGKYVLLSLRLNYVKGIANTARAD